MKLFSNKPMFGVHYRFHRRTIEMLREQSTFAKSTRGSTYLSSVRHVFALYIRHGLVNYLTLSLENRGTMSYFIIYSKVATLEKITTAPALLSMMVFHITVVLFYFNKFLYTLQYGRRYLEYINRSSCHSLSFFASRWQHIK